ncbi:MAG: hypothetical protein C6W58_17345 [Bacillaceae bacterium]|nr:MAG: hypothetical protein C6W58_17345 [Bacillaceae bacterium]
MRGYKFSCNRFISSIRAGYYDLNGKLLNVKGSFLCSTKTQIQRFYAILCKKLLWRLPNFLTAALEFHFFQIIA